MSQQQLKKQRGFTLVEMVVVIAVIGVLMGIAFQGFTTIQQNARDTRRVADLRKIQVQLELYFVKCGHYPTTGTCRNPGEGAGSLTKRQLISELVEAGAREEEIPKDPIAAREYLYGFGLSGLSYLIAADTERAGNNREVTGLIYGIDCNTLFCIRS